jgi:hypothetical protein
MKRWHLAAAALVLLAVAGLWVWRAVEAQRPQGSDEAQIRALILDCARAAERRDARVLAHWISEEYRDANGFSAEIVQRQAARILANAREVRAFIPADSLTIQVGLDRDTASAAFSVQFRASGKNGELRFEGPLQLRLRREPVRYYLIFPGAEWRVAGVDGYSMDSAWE